jgi:putative transposase
VSRPYNIVTRAARKSAAVIEQFCRTNGQILLPLLNLIENASQVVETVIHELGHQTLEQILVLSAEQVAGPRTPGKASGEIRYHGWQSGRVQLVDRKLRVKRPQGFSPNITNEPVTFIS